MNDQSVFCIDIINHNQVKNLKQLKLFNDNKYCLYKLGRTTSGNNLYKELCKQWSAKNSIRIL